MADSTENTVQGQFLDHVWVIHRTKNRSHAGTNAKFQLCFERSDHKQCWFDFKEYDYDERSPGRTDMYGFKLQGEGILEVSWIRIEMKPDSSDDATWLPDRIFIIGRLQSGLFKLLAIHTSWSKEFTKHVGHFVKNPGLALDNGVEAAFVVGADEV